MKCRTVTILNKLGLHARASAKFVNMASRYHSDITIKRDGQRISGKSIMGIMMLAASQGSEIMICADGHDEEEAIDKLCWLIDDYFGEDE